MVFQKVFHNVQENLKLCDEKALLCLVDHSFKICYLALLRAGEGVEMGGWTVKRERVRVGEGKRDEFILKLLLGLFLDVK